MSDDLAAKVQSAQFVDLDGRPEAEAIAELEQRVLGAEAAAAMPEPTENERPEIDPDIVEPVPEDTEMTLIELPSRQVPYEWDELHIRRMRVPELAKLSRARNGNSITTIIEALAKTVDKPIRGFAMPDLIFVMYWHRINSYQKNKFTIPWTSRYGNSHKYPVTNAGLEIVSLDRNEETKALLESYRAKGIDFPRLRAVEVYQNTPDLSEDQDMLLEMATYLVGEQPLTEKLKILESAEGLELYEEIEQFKKDFTIGVKQYITVQDAMFEPATASAYLKEKGTELYRASEKVVEKELAMVLRLRAEDFLEEAAQIDTLLESGGEIKAREEVIDVSITVDHFFLS